MTADRTKREIANSLSVNNASLCFATKFPSTSELLRRRQAEKKMDGKETLGRRILKRFNSFVHITMELVIFVMGCDIEAFHLIFYYYSFKRMRKRQST